MTTLASATLREDSSTLTLTKEGDAYRIRLVQVLHPGDEPDVVEREHDDYFAAYKDFANTILAVEVCDDDEPVIAHPQAGRSCM